jgi:DNA-binding NarL/FixJ family response regulator
MTSNLTGALRDNLCGLSAEYVGQDFILSNGQVANLPYLQLPYLPHSIGLTEREREVLRWLVQGSTDLPIAEQLVVSRRMAHVHLRAIKPFSLCRLCFLSPL